MKRIYIGIDDTDNDKTQRDTGWTALEMTDQLREVYGCHAVSRHQLLKDASVGYTRSNNTYAIHINASEERLREIIDLAQVLLHQLYSANSAPALCVGTEDQLVSIVEFGKRCKREVETVDDAMQIVKQAGVFVAILSQRDAGVVGAVAGAALAADGSDGTFIAYRKLRKLHGLLSVERILDGGVELIETTDGKEVLEGQVDVGAKGLQPAIREHQPVLYVKPSMNGHWEIA